jgi:hypothetical protein
MSRAKEILNNEAVGSKATKNATHLNALINKINFNLDLGKFDPDLLKKANKIFTTMTNNQEISPVDLKRFASRLNSTDSAVTKTTLNGWYRTN